MKQFIVVLIVSIALTSCAPGASATDVGKQAYYAAQQIVENHLKAPSTAKFSNILNDSNTGYRVIRQNLYEAWGWVDSQNSFSAMIRSEWRMVIQHQSGKYQALYMKIGDQEVGDYQSAITLPAQVTAQAAKDTTLREFPNSDAKSMGIMPAVQTFSITMQSNYSWVRVELNGLRGWVQVFQVRINGKLSDVPAASDADLGK